MSRDENQCVPYFAQRSRKPSHCLVFGMSRAFPKNGSGLGPGGVGSPRERARHATIERKYKKARRISDKPSAYNRLDLISAGRTSMLVQIMVYIC